MRPLVTALQGRLVKVYFGFQKIEEVIGSYTEILNAIDLWFQRMYQNWAEKRPRFCSRQRNQEIKRPSIVSCTVLEAIGDNTLPCRNLSELKSRFRARKREHIMSFVLLFLK